MTTSPWHLRSRHDSNPNKQRTLLLWRLKRNLEKRNLCQAGGSRHGAQEVSNVLKLRMSIWRHFVQFEGFQSWGFFFSISLPCKESWQSCSVRAEVLFHWIVYELHSTFFSFFFFTTVEVPNFASRWKFVQYPYARSETLIGDLCHKKMNWIKFTVLKLFSNFQFFFFCRTLHNVIRPCVKKMAKFPQDAKLGAFTVIELLRSLPKCQYAWTLCRF